jgi:hypothetical protein
MPRKSAERKSESAIVTTSDDRNSGARVASGEQINRESADRYRRSLEEVNRSRDSDIEKALRS